RRRRELYALYTAESTGRCRPSGERNRAPIQRSCKADRCRKGNSGAMAASQGIADAWRDNDAALQPMLAQSKVAQELVPLSQGLNQVAVIGLQALDNLENSRAMDANTRSQNLSALKSAAKPQAVLIDMVASCVQLLVEATKTQ